MALLGGPTVATYSAGILTHELPIYHPMSEPLSYHYTRVLHSTRAALVCIGKEFD